MYFFKHGSPSCPYHLFRWIQVEHIEVNVLVDRNFGLLFNLTNPQRINVPSCLCMTIFSTTLKGIMISLDLQACMLSPMESINIRERLDLLPALSYKAHHNKKILQEVQREQDISSCEQWFHIKNDGDNLHPKRRNLDCL